MEQDRFMYANTSENMQVIYAIHKKNGLKVIETFIDFMPSHKLRLFSYDILFIRKVTEKDLAVIKKIDEQDRKQGFEITRFIQRFWCHKYKTLSALIDDDKDLVDQQTLNQIKEKLKNHFIKLNKNQMELFV
ncbi:hypothetical protein V9L05_18065 [Bernardetia sp. Wsw4-3y2]|uniref:hypothetical protein n=1 Tax=Bernardetia sp. Wsw4-3y2 TaxID=3127471 RepID=UPI0030CE995E